jgi:hypothetical protein
LFVDEAKGDASRLSRLPMAKLMRRFLRRMVADVVVGDRKRSELFDPVTLDPIVAPTRAGR